MPKEYWSRIPAILRKAIVRGSFLLALFSIFLLVGFEHPGMAQSISPNLLQNLAGQAQQNGLGSTQPSQNLPPSITLQPASPESPPFLPPSRLEEIMSMRAGARLQQFGYDQLGLARSVVVPETGAVQDDYVMGPGDEVVVSLRGQENNDFRAFVDRNGQILLPRLPPISAGGRTFGSFRQDVEAAVHRAYVASTASVSIGQVRQISVLVSGEVNIPGQRLLTGLSSAVDALQLSGGVKKTGSLRNIRIQRGGREFSIDLYSVLTTTGGGSALRLADGDRILVPPLGKTVAVTGLVRQPGIYELAPLQSSVSVRNLLTLAGGQELRGRYRLSILHIGEDGRTDFVPAASENATVRDSEILFVQLGADQTTSQAMLSGGVGLAGAYPIVLGTKLSQVLKAPGALGTSPYTLFGIISRRDPHTLLRTLVPFTPVAVLNGSEDQALQADDIIRSITLKEARLITSTIQSFLQQRNQDEQALLNPLSAISNAQPPAIVPAGAPGATTSSTTTQSNSGSALTEKSSRSSGELAQDEESEIQLIGNFTQRQLDMVASGQVKVSDFRYLPERTQNLDGQGVYLPLSADPEAAQSAAISAQAMQQNNPAQMQFNSYGQGLPVPMQGAPGPQNGFSAQQNNGYYRQPDRLPAPNFQEEPSTSGIFPSNREAPTFNALAQQLGVDPLVLVNFIIDHQVTLDGAVRGPGSYFVGPGASLKDLVQAAGGTVNWADDSGVELISTAVDTNSGRSVTQRTSLPLQQGLLASYIVKPHDGFRFSQVFNDGNIGNVTVQGELRYTGNYRITRGEHLSDLLAQAGGLTSTAYPSGTIFLRRSAADTERQGYIRASNEIEDQLVVAMTRIGNDKIDATTFASMQAFVNQLRTQPAVGRISVTADPSVLAAKPELDPLLEPGDVVYVPQRPSTIAVLGQVSQPGNFPYRSGLTMADYIAQAGGYSVTSDESMTFVVMPDGSARKTQSSWLSFDSQSLPPGSTIVVPRDVTPLDTRQVILDISSIFSQLAVSAASLAVLATEVK
jgi:protein involved in polysaccharide export with SLBB domain